LVRSTLGSVSDVKNDSIFFCSIRHFFAPAINP
jgi:hypothetical protein